MPSPVPSLVSVPLLILDLAVVGCGQSAGDAFAASVKVAQRAELVGYERIWYAEHHNMASIGSSATSVLIGHIADQTTSIRLGAGGIMLPNHSPLVIAEQFGTLATLHPGRIDLGLGRAPGSDRNTMRALRRDAHSSDRLREDVLGLQGYLQGGSRPTVRRPQRRRSRRKTRGYSAPDGSVTAVVVCNAESRESTFGADRGPVGGSVREENDP